MYFFVEKKVRPFTFGFLECTFCVEKKSGHLLWIFGMYFFFEKKRVSTFTLDLCNVHFGFLKCTFFVGEKG